MRLGRRFGCKCPDSCGSGECGDECLGHVFGGTLAVLLAEWHLWHGSGMSLVAFGLRVQSDDDDGIWEFLRG